MHKRILLAGLAVVCVACAKDETATNNNAPITPIENNTPIANAVKNPDRIFQLEDLAKTTIKTPGGDLTLWQMDNEDKRREGMMFLKDPEVKDNEGMIFLFDKPQKGENYGFWMKNTLLPLDIVYISKDKKVLNVGKGMALSEDVVKPSGEYFYVIEVKQGLAPKFGLNPGAKVDISSSLKGLP